MQALVSRSESTPLEWQELPDRHMRKDEIRVAVKAAGVNPVDWKMRGVSLLSSAHWLLGPNGPFVCGVDFAGVVTEIGPDVTLVKVGDSVVGGTDFSKRQRGSYAKTVQVRQEQVAVLPAGVPFDVAACLPVAGVTAQTCLFALGGLGERKDAKVLVLGASGGVGHLAIQLARNAGARVVGVCSSRNVPLVTRLGVTAVDYGAGDALDAAKAHGPFDIIVDAIGSKTYPIGRCRQLHAPGARHVLVMPVPADYLRLAFTPWLKAVLGRPTGANLAPLAADVAAGRLEVVIEERIPFDEAERAHQISKAGRVVGKLVLVA